ncbi:TraB/GumN family protein [Novosphingobium aureum]|nr:TraB/GumN family protein [Novosphingobium aureum]
MRSMKSRLIGGVACAISLFLSPSLSAREPTATPAQVEPGRPALWKVADEDTTIWLFGTIHILPKPVDWYQGPVASALDGAQTLVTEVPMNDDKAAQAAIMSKATREDGKTLRATLSDEGRADYEAALGQFGLPVAMFDGNDAWFAALMLTMLPLQLSGYDLENGIDRQVAAKASARGMANEAFETPEYQISLFDTLPAETQERYLAEVVDALPTMKDDIARMVEAWRTGKAEVLAELLNQQEDDPRIREVLLTERNRHWAQWLEKRLDEPGSVFVAVGAGHLAGEDSVQALLAAKGITAERVQ